QFFASGIDCEAVVIAAPTESHFDLARQAILEKKHVLLEKPLASTVAQAEELARLAKISELHCVVGQVERCNPAVKKLEEIIAGGWLGTPIHFSFTRVGGYPQTVKNGNNVLLDLAIHDLDIL